MDKITNEFLIECQEHLEGLDQDLVSLERAPDDEEMLSRIFRVMHTIKGSCGFLGFSHLEKLTHAGENLLTMVREGNLILNPECTSALLSLVDAIREILVSVESSGKEGENSYAELLARLERCVRPESKRSSSRKSRRLVMAKGLDSSNNNVEEEPEKFGSLLIQSGKVKPEVVEEAACQQHAGDPRHLGEILVEKGAIEPTEVRKTLETQKASGVLRASRNIRVEVEALDRLMNLVGELVLARNQVLQFAAKQEDSIFQATSKQLNLITTELQEGVMKTRMQSIGRIWDKFPRVVRDLAIGCGKEVRVEMEGRDTELDMTLVEALKDPLTHLIRNTVDHGIEAPDEREKCGKTREGRLFLSAFHEGGQVIIKISDDGAGINTDRIKKQALQRGIITPEQATRISKRDLLNLIFLPGFSTAHKITNVSGRGVGMDVVKTNIEKIGGTVDLQSIPGQGTTIRIKVPLTLAIIPALIISCGSDRYAIPQVNLLELVRLEGEISRKGIEHIHGAPVYRLRGNLLPLVFLHKELGVEAEHDKDTTNIVVLQADERTFGLVVDGVSDTEEIVVKPLGKQLKGVSALAGATIMGDGRVALILDVLGLAQKANVVTKIRESTVFEQRTTKASAPQDSDAQALLVFKVGKLGRMAMPLSVVARLEEFPAERVEHSGGQLVMQYRDQIMPLVQLSNILNGYGAIADELPENLQVVVYAKDGRYVGLMVEQIVDIVKECVSIKRKRSETCIQETCVIQGQITDLLDVEGVIHMAEPDFFEQAMTTTQAAGG